MATTRTTAPKIESTVQDITADMTAKVESMVAETQNKVETMVADTQKNVSEQFEKLTKSLESLTAMGQENIDAFAKSSEIAAKAVEGIGSEISAFTKKSFEDSVAAAQDLASAKTMTELFEKQTAFAQSAFEGWVGQTTKMNEIFVAAAKDVTAPLGERVTAATEKMKTLTAA